MLKERDRLSNTIETVSVLLKDANANKVQKHFQLHDLSMGEYVTDMYALWLDFRMIDENALHGMGREIGREGGGITL